MPVSSEFLSAVISNLVTAITFSLLTAIMEVLLFYFINELCFETNMDMPHGKHIFFRDQLEHQGKLHWFV